MSSASPTAAYLEFIRNLTPQIVFGTCYMLLRLQIDVGKVQLDWDGFKNAVSLWSCAFLLFGSMLANMKRLIDSVSTANERLEIEMMRIRSRQLAAGPTTLAIFRAAWRLNKRGLLQFFLVVAVSYAGMFVVIEMASLGAISSIKNTLR